MTRHAVQAKAAGIEMDLVITYADGVDRAVFEQHLTDTYGLSLTSGYSRPNPPSRLTNIDEVVGLLPALGAFLAVLALLGLGHSLTVASRAGRREYGVLSALGLIRRRAGHVVTWHSAIIAMVGLMIGVPIGITVGRIGWNLMTSNLGMLGGPATPWAALGATAVVSLALALLIAWPVAHHFTRGRPADLLRAE
jgi:ABC-type antimicrobial peptide transport system permease subunit